MLECIQQDGAVDMPEAPLGHLEIRQQGLFVLLPFFLMKENASEKEILCIDLIESIVFSKIFIAF